MSKRQNMAQKITVRKVEPGEARYGCDPQAVQVLFVESTTLPNKPNLAYLRGLFEGKGFQSKEVDPVKDVPFLRLCVYREAFKPVTVDEVLAVLRLDPEEVDLSQINILR
jgi:hypothetical protein